MAKLGTQVYRDWALGVINSLRPDELPLNASPRGKDSALVSVGAGRCIVGKRRGSELVINELVPNTEPVISQFLFRPSLTTRYHLLVDGDGNIWHKEDNGDLTSVGNDVVSGDDPVLWAQMKNLGFFVDGTTQKKVVDDSGTLVVQNFGITRPSAPTVTETVGGGSGDAAGTWRIAITYYNDDTGHESSLSDYDTQVLSNGNRLGVAWTAPTDTQVTHVRVYVLREGTNTEFVSNLGVMEYAAGTSPQNVVVGVGGLENFFDIAPSLVENDPPPSTTKGVVKHLSRMFAWDDEKIYWSGIDAPESFNLAESFQPVDSQDGSPIVVCHEVDENTLAIFKEEALYGLFGVDPNSWELRLIDPSAGAVSPRSVVTIEGFTYFWSKHGPMAWNHSSAPQQIGYAAIQQTVEPNAIGYDSVGGVVAVADPTNQRVLFAFPLAGSSVNNAILPFNYRLKVWEADLWQPYDVASLLLAEDADNRQYVWVGGQYGHVFKWWTQDTDGARLAVTPTVVSGITRSGSVATVTTTSNHHLEIGNTITISGAVQDEYNGTFTVTGVTSTTFTYTLTGTPATPATGTPSYTGVYTIQGEIQTATSSTIVAESTANLDADRLIGLYVYAIAPDMSAFERRRITNVNASTKTITISPDWSVTPVDGGGWGYVLSGPMFEWDTKWDDYTEPFNYKRFMFLYVDAVCDEGNTTAYVDVFLDSSTTSTAKRFAFTLSGSGAVFDEDEFDLGVFGGDGINSLRKRIGNIARTYRYRVRHYDNNRQLVLLKLGNSAHMLTDRRS